MKASKQRMRMCEHLAHQSLRIIAAIQGASQEQVFKEALNDKLRQQNMPAIA